MLHCDALKMKLVARKASLRGICVVPTLFAPVTWALPTRHNTKSDSATVGAECVLLKIWPIHEEVAESWLMFGYPLDVYKLTSEDMTRLCRAKISHPECSLTWLLPFLSFKRFSPPPRSITGEEREGESGGQKALEVSCLHFCPPSSPFFPLHPPRVVSFLHSNLCQNILKRSEPARASMSPTDVDDDKCIKAFARNLESNKIFNEIRRDI